MSGNSDVPQKRTNPFSPMAVARITDFDADPDAVDVTITTDAMRQAQAHVFTYLDADGADRAGVVIAILGDYGTGKTHLAVQLVRQVQQRLNDRTRAMYLDATAESFVALYRRFMNKLGLDGVRSQVSDYYADIVADSLQSTGLSSDMLDWLNSRKLEPQEVVEHFGLMESALLRKVQEELRAVTENKDFGTALTLLLRNGFENSVWAWLTGGKPDQVLLDRGITTPIDNEVASLEAMGVFAMLFGGRRRRFVLVIDELDKIFSADSDPKATSSRMGAFQTLLEVFGRAGACLVLCGLHDFTKVLSPAVRERIPHTVTMSGLSQKEVREFVVLAQKPLHSTDPLAPFTIDAIRYIRDITGGNARKVINMCHRVFQLVDDAAGPPDRRVTDDMVRQATRDLFGAMSADDIEGVVRRTLTANGWPYQYQHLLGTSPDSLADFWIPFPGHDGGCAVLITRSLLDRQDVDTVLRWISATSRAAPDAELVLLVNGVVSAAVTIQLREPLGREPMIYLERTFTEDFKALVTAISPPPGEPGEQDSTTALRQRMEQLTQQQSNTYGLLEQISEYVRTTRTSSDSQFVALQRQVRALTQAPDSARRTPETSLPDPVERIFRGAIDALEDVVQLDTMLSEAFASSQDEIKYAVQRRLASAEFTTAAGFAILMQSAVRAFREAIAEWFRTIEVDPSGTPSNETEDELDRLCIAYDDIVYNLPVFKLGALFALPAWNTRVGGVVRTEPSQSSRTARVEEALNNFSPRVRRAALQAGRAAAG